MSHLKYDIDKTYANAIEQVYVVYVCKYGNYITNNGLLLILP